MLDFWQRCLLGGITQKETLGIGKNLRNHKEECHKFKKIFPKISGSLAHWKYWCYVVLLLKVEGTSAVLWWILSHPGKMGTLWISHLNIDSAAPWKILSLHQRKIMKT
jgi:hypothetical protein